jgi:hypothetical protein
MDKISIGGVIMAFISNREFEIKEFIPDEGSMVPGGLGYGSGTIYLNDLESNKTISRKCTFMYNWYIRHITISYLDGFQKVGIDDDIPYDTPLKINEFTWNGKVKHELRQSDFFR